MTYRSPVERAWTDAWGRRRDTPRHAADAVLAAMQTEPGEMRRAATVVAVARRGQSIAPAGELVVEDGTSLGRVTVLPRDVPYGYHRLLRGSSEQLLLVAPQRCPLPDDLRGWGWVVQLYAARSERSWGIGDLADLRRLAGWSAQLGAGALLVSPLGAANPSPDPEPSPYYPSSRRFRNPLYLSLEEVPGYASLAAELAPLARQARALNERQAIDRVRVQAIKLAALERIWRALDTGSGRDRELAQFLAAKGAPMRQWCVFAALSEELGPGWTRWPVGLRDPAGTAVGKAAERLTERIAFHAWLQLLLDQQLAAASRATSLIGDLPVGFDPGGFDAWAWQALLAPASIGAPPDVFNPAGQRWGLPPFVPHRLRLAGYAPFVETIRANLAHGGGLRIDHVLGLFRQWWVPDGAAPADGAYVRQPTEELLAVLAIESHRAGAIVIGEDLGTVAAGVRRRLASANVLSTRLGFFERRPPARWPRRSLAAITTHDLPTIAGAWTGEDLDDQARAGIVPDVRAMARLRARLSVLAGVPVGRPLREVVLRAHAALSTAPPVLAMATLEDALLDPRRPNLPGTDRAHRDNWSRALPATLERIEQDPFVHRLARTMGEGRGGER
jgi:4-alpha-glucanotransferase